MAFKWTTMAAAPGARKEGQLIKPYSQPLSKVAEGAIRAGLLVERGTNRQQVKPMAALPAADADAIATAAASLASAATAQVWAGATNFNGTIGVKKIFPARSLSFTLNSHADWDATVMIVHGWDCAGNPIHEPVHIPDAGNVVLYTANAFSQIGWVDMPAQSGTNGTVTIGVVSDKSVELSTRDCGVAIYDRERETNATTTVTYSDEDSLSICRHGQIAVIVEDAVVPGDLVSVRMVLSAPDVRGQFAKMPSQDPASLVYVPLLGAKYLTSTSADGVAIVELAG